MFAVARMLPHEFFDYLSKEFCTVMSIRPIRANEWLDYQKVISIPGLPLSFNLKRYAKANRLHVIELVQENRSVRISLIHPDLAMPLMKKWMENKTTTEMAVIKLLKQYE